MSNTFILQGGPENVEWFEAFQKYGQRFKNLTHVYWTCPKSARKGDHAFIYLTAPLSRIVGKADIIGEPFFNDVPYRFDNKFMEGKWCCEIDIEFAFDVDSELLTMKNFRKLFGHDWGWVRYPRGSVKIPEEILPAFLELARLGASPGV